jgi:transcriptional regulator with XRE-family HTH domain
MGQLRNKALLKKIGRRVKEVRLENKITQQKFYFDTEIHIARIETGEQNISVSTLDAICKYFKIALTTFFENIEK